MTELPPEALPDYERRSSQAIFLHGRATVRSARDAEGDRKAILAAATELGRYAHVRERADGYPILGKSDREIAERLLKAALKGAKAEPGTELAEQIAFTVRDGFELGLMEPAPVFVAPLPRRSIELELDIERRVEEIARNRTAVRRLDEWEAEEAAQHRAPVDVGTLDDMLTRPDTERWRVEGLLPAEGRLLVVAQRKIGKTTLVNNLTASLVTGEPFLGTMPVEKVDGRVMLLNYEVSGATFARWLGDLGLSKKAQRRIVVVNMRGRDNLLATDNGRDKLATMMREHDVKVLAVDPFGRAFSGDNQDSNSQVTPWLNALDRVATEGGATEVILVAHAGWGGSERGQAAQVRARGASALEDWADSIVRYSRDSELDGAPRFLEAEGRDVFLDKDRLAYDPETRRLTLTGQGGPKAARRAGKAAELTEPILDIVRQVQGIGSSGIADELRKRDDVHFSKGDESAAITYLVAAGQLSRFKDGRVWRHYTPGHVPAKFSGVTPVGIQTKRRETK